MLMAIGAAVVGGALNAISGAAEDREMEKRKQQALAMLRENIIDPNELDAMLNNVNRLFNNRLVNTLNTTALRSRGAANSNVVKGIVGGQIEGARAQSLTDTNLKAEDANRATYSQMAGIEQTMGGTHNFFGDFAAGAIKAAPVGMELSKMLSPNTISPGAQPLANGETGAYTGDPNASNMSNPFIDKTKIAEKDWMNFDYQSANTFWAKKAWE